MQTRSSGGGLVKKRSSGGGLVKKRSFSGGSVKKKSYGCGSLRWRLSEEEKLWGGSVKKRSFSGGSLKKRSYGGVSLKKISYGGGSMQRSCFGGASVRKRSSGGGSVRKPKKRLDAVPMGFSVGDMGRPAINPAPRKSTPARPANLRVMIISAQTRPTPSPYKPRLAVQYISCHPYLALASSTCGFREAVASSVPPPPALRLMGSLQSDSRISLGRLLLIRVFVGSGFLVVVVEVLVRPWWSSALLVSDVDDSSGESVGDVVTRGPHRLSDDWINKVVNGRLLTVGLVELSTIEAVPRHMGWWDP
ncbi:hypothetical protein YC2023_103465 [Brassica napus]